MEPDTIRVECLKIIVASCIGRSVEHADELIAETRKLEAYVNEGPWTVSTTGDIFTDAKKIKV